MKLALNNEVAIHLMDENSENIEATTTERRVELKYQITSEVAAKVREWARRRLDPDENCCDGDDEYPVSTLYLDTPDWDIYYRRKDTINGKHRVRRYGNESTLWLETKRKSNCIVRKKRTAIDVQEFNYIWSLNPILLQPIWTGDWFRQRVQEKQMQPAVVVSYKRFARNGISHLGPLRLTIDRHIQGRGAGDSLLPKRDLDGFDLLPNAEILEMKFTDHLPAIFKELLMEFELGTSGFSKYRSAVSMSGLVG